MNDAIVAIASDPQTAELLRHHPRVGEVTLGMSGDLLFRQGDWRRALVSGPCDGPYGLVELIDNNPMVCADIAGLPTAAGTLALIATAPLIEAGILVEAATMLTNAPADAARVDRDLATTGWTGGIIVDVDERELNEVYAATVVAAITTPAHLDEIDDLYEERFGRSFFIRRDETSAWDVALVHGKPHAVFRLRIAEDHPVSLLTIQVMADKNGKCGAAQRVHAMNVMCGFEESLGIA